MPFWEPASYGLAGSAGMAGGGASCAQATQESGGSARSTFGSYESTYSQEGRELKVVRRSSGARGVLPPEKIAELADWFRAMAKDDAKFILVEPGPSASSR